MQSTSTPLPFANIKPVGIYSYIDKLNVRLTRPLTRSELANLRQHCGHVYVHAKPARFDWRLDQQRQTAAAPAVHQHLHLHQPSDAAIELLARRDGAHQLNYPEVALEWTFDDAWEREAAAAYFDCHAVKDYQRGEVRYFKTTRYTAARRAPNNLVSYHDRPSKITGAAYCLKIEWRIRGARPLRRAGLTSLDDILRLDHHTFWLPRLKLFDIDTVALGRLYTNWENNGRRRGDWIISHALGNGRTFDYDVYGSRGSCIFHNLRTVQAVINAYRQHFMIMGTFH